jgi:hypothetical protein
LLDQWMVAAKLLKISCNGVNVRAIPWIERMAEAEFFHFAESLSSKDKA